MRKLSSSVPARANSGDLIITKNSCNQNVVLSAKDRFNHLLLLGPSRLNGRMRTISSLLQQDISNPEWGVIVFDLTGQTANEVREMSKNSWRNIIFFDPTRKTCPRFNPLAYKENDVIENIITTFKMLNPDSPQFFTDLNDKLLKNAIKVLKRLDASDGVEGKYTTFISLNRLLQNTNGQGRDWVNQFSRITSSSDSEASENRDIAAWFLNEYFPERSEAYDNTFGVRSQISKLVSNEYLHNVLNPNFSNGECNEIDFDLHLANGGVLCISLAHAELRDLSKYLAHFLFFALQSSVFRRSRQQEMNRPYALYLDDFHKYISPEFVEILSCGEHYGISAVLSAQSRTQIVSTLGEAFAEKITVDVPNIILHPGLSYKDATYYSDLFAEDSIEQESGKRYGISSAFIMNGIKDWFGYKDIIYRLMQNGRIGRADSGDFLQSE